jgi:hypothetical protein
VSNTTTNNPLSEIENDLAELSAESQTALRGMARRMASNDSSLTKKTLQAFISKHAISIPELRIETERQKLLIEADRDEAYAAEKDVEADKHTENQKPLVDRINEIVAASQKLDAEYRELKGSLQIELEAASSARRFAKEARVFVEEKRREVEDSRVSGRAPNIIAELIMDDDAPDVFNGATTIRNPVQVSAL